MSLKALSWSFEQEIFSSSQKFVLVALANFASETGMSYPAVETICRITQQNEKTVRKALVELAEQGIIRDTGKKYGATQRVKVWELPDAAKEIKSTQKRIHSNPGGIRAESGSNLPANLPKFGEQSFNHEPLNLEPLISAGAVSGEEGNNPTAEKKQPPKVPVPPSVPPPTEYQKFVAGWDTMHEEVFGEKYDYSNMGRDGKQLNEKLAAGKTAAELLDVARRAWNLNPRTEKFRRDQSMTIHGLCQNLPEIKAALRETNGYKKPDTSKGF
jgi:hypothetical protein